MATLTQPAAATSQAMATAPAVFPDAFQTGYQLTDQFLHIPVSRRKATVNSDYIFLNWAVVEADQAASGRISQSCSEEEPSCVP
jgi:hypothetical protein